MSLYRFLVRGGTAANLAAVNEVPLARELIVATDTGRLKLGDGSTAYNTLPYISPGKFDMAGLSDGDVFAWDATAQMFVATAPGGGGGTTLPTTYGQYLAASLEPGALEALQYNTFSYAINSTTTKLLLASWQTRLGSSGRFEQRNPQRFMPLRGVTLSGTGTGSAAIILNPAAATYADPWNTYYTRLGNLQTLPTKYVPVTGASTVVPLLPGPYGSILTHVTCFNLAWLALRWSGSSIGINLWDEVSDATTQRMGDSLLLPLSKKVASEVESSTTSSSTGGSASGAVCLVDLPSTWSEIADPLETAYGVPTFRDDFMGTTLDTTVWTRAQAVAGNVEIDTTRPWLKFVGSSSWGANGLYKTTKQARSNGRKLIVDHYTGRNTSAQGTGMFGWSDGLGQSYSNFAHAINFAGSGGTLNIYENGTLRGTVGSGWTEGTIYRLYIEQTTTGAIYKIQGGTQYPAIGSASWTTLTPGTSSSSTATLTPGATAWFGTSYVSDFRVYG